MEDREEQSGSYDDEESEAWDSDIEDDDDHSSLDWESSIDEPDSSSSSAADFDDGESGSDAESNDDVIFPDRRVSSPTTPPPESRTTTTTADPAKIEAFIPQPTVFTGQTNNFASELRREANDNELRLNVKSEAEALSHVFQNAKGEFSLALFGPWGRGKSTFLNELKKRLKHPKSDEFKTHSIYETIDFSAWKYRTNPEIWVHLYDCFAKTLFRGNPWCWFRAVLREKLNRYRIVPYVILIILMLVAGSLLNSIGELSSRFIEILGYIGVSGGALYLLNLAQRLLGLGVVSGIKRYLVLSNHKEKLGLQAAIGDDLKSLLVAWIQPGAFYEKKWIFQYVLVTAAFYFFGAWYKQILPELWRAWVDFMVLAFSAVVGIGFYHKLKQPQKILLCIDDLDRCDPETMLEIIESLKLLLDDEEINKRLQIIFLIDQEILNFAISNKYKRYVDAVTTSEEEERKLHNWIIYENHEKYFLAHFKLQQLSQSDLLSLVEAYTGILARESSPTKSKIEPGDVVYSESEKVALRKAIESSSTRKAFRNRPTQGMQDETDQRRLNFSPRRVRYILNQYQIAKLLLRENGADLNQQTLNHIASKIAQAVLNDSSLDNFDSSHPHLKTVLQQVC